MAAFIGAGEMAHDIFKLKVSYFYMGQVFFRDAQAIHACIDMNGCRQPAFLPAGKFSIFLRLSPMIEHRSNVMRSIRQGFAPIKAIQGQDLSRLAYNLS